MTAAIAALVLFVVIALLIICGAFDVGGDDL